MMTSHIATYLLLALSLCHPTSAQVEPGAVTGHVLQADGTPVVGAEVVLTEGATGYPLRRGTSHSVFTATDEASGGSFAGWWTATTDVEGGFLFDGVVPGSYHLVAQSWIDSEIEGADPSAALGPRSMLPAKATTACGVARVEVTSGVTARADLRALGDVTFSYELGASNNDWYLVVSTSAPAADPILGFVGWRGAFAKDAIALVRMQSGKAQVRGLPAQPLHYAVFASDSIPGFATGSFRGDLEPRHAHGTPLVNGWSNIQGHPTDELAPLVAAVAKLRASHGRKIVHDRLVLGREEAWKRASEMRAPHFVQLLTKVDTLGPLDRRVSLVNAGPTYTVADLLAADAYATIASRIEAREMSEKR